MVVRINGKDMKEVAAAPTVSHGWTVRDTVELLIGAAVGFVVITMAPMFVAAANIIIGVFYHIGG